MSSPWFSLEVDVRGAEEARAALEKLRKSLCEHGRMELKDEALDCARLLEQWMHSFVHPVSGKLDRAMESRPYRGTIPAAFVRVDYKKAPHAHLVEFGTVHMAAKPYFRRAIITAGPMILGRIERKTIALAKRGGAT